MEVWRIRSCSIGEKIIKDNQEMRELWPKIKWHLFYPDTVYIDDVINELRSSGGGVQIDSVFVA